MEISVDANDADASKSDDALTPARCSVTGELEAFEPGGDTGSFDNTQALSRRDDSKEAGKWCRNVREPKLGEEVQVPEQKLCVVLCCISEIGLPNL